MRIEHGDGYVDVTIMGKYVVIETDDGEECTEVIVPYDTARDLAAVIDSAAWDAEHPPEEP